MYCFFVASEFWGTPGAIAGFSSLPSLPIRLGLNHVQVENEYANLVRGDHDTESVEFSNPILRQVECKPEELAKLRSAGKWYRYLGAKGCYLWINSLTREVTPLRPDDYVDEEASSEAMEEEDLAGESFGLREKGPKSVRERQVWASRLRQYAG